MKFEKIKSMLNIVSLCLTALLAIMTLFAWYCVNKVANVEGGMGTTASDESIIIDDTLTAVRYNLDGEVITDTYTQSSSGKLYLTKRVVKDTSNKETTTTYTLSDNKVFKMEKMLPGEYVNITISFRMVEGNNGSAYRIRLDDVSGGLFQVDGYNHYASGAFKTKSISLKNNSGTSLKDFTSASYTWLGSYAINQNDIQNNQVELVSDTWHDTDVKISYTFQIFEDFTKYYQLVGQASESCDAKLSNLELSIGKIFIIAG